MGVFIWAILLGKIINPDNKIPVFNKSINDVQKTGKLYYEKSVGDNYSKFSLIQGCIQFFFINLSLLFLEDLENFEGSLWNIFKKCKRKTSQREIGKQI